MDYQNRVAQAVQQFWQVRAEQYSKQRIRSHGTHGAVAGGKHLDGFISLLAGLLSEAGLPDSSIHTQTTTLPGYFRPTKAWDLVIIVEDQLLAAIEFKAQIGSFGNNFNNRVEEALGNATDLLTMYREGGFNTSRKPWLGWFMLLEDSPDSTSPVRLKEPHFEVHSDFKNISYAKRYELFCERLIREELYDATCLLMSNETIGLQGGYSEPNPEVDFSTFVNSLLTYATAHADIRS